MTSLNESTVEDTTLEWFGELGLRSATGRALVCRVGTRLNNYP